MKLAGWSSGLLLALTPMPGFAQTGPAPSPEPQTASAKPAADKKVCRKDVSTGSILTKSVCRTKAEWTALDSANQRSADQALSRRGSTFNAQP